MLNGIFNIHILEFSSNTPKTRNSSRVSFLRLQIRANEGRIDEDDLRLAGLITLNGSNN